MRRRLPRAKGEHSNIKVVPSSSDPGDNAQYTITFIADGALLPGTDDIDIKMEDFDIPESISTSRIAMRIADRAEEDNPSTADMDESEFSTVTNTRATNPDAVIVDGDKITLTVPDFSIPLAGTATTEGVVTTGREIGILAGDRVSIIFASPPVSATPPREGLNTPERPIP